MSDMARAAAHQYSRTDCDRCGQYMAHGDRILYGRGQYHHDCADDEMADEATNADDQICYCGDRLCPLCAHRDGSWGRFR